MLTYGREPGLQRLEKSGLRIQHPSEFFVQEIAETVDDAVRSMGLGLGPHANMLIRRAALPVVVPNLPDDERATIHDELSAAAERQTEAIKATPPVRPAAPVTPEGGPGDPKPPPLPASVNTA